MKKLANIYKVNYNFNTGTKIFVNGNLLLAKSSNIFMLMSMRNAFQDTSQVADNSAQSVRWFFEYLKKKNKHNSLTTQMSYLIRCYVSLCNNCRTL